MSEVPASRPTATHGEIFGAFLLIGATSFGGGVVAFLREGLVAKHRWVDDEQFISMLSISQTLPGLNATNMAVLVGDAFFVALQFAAKDWIALGATKTGVVYRLKGNAPNAHE